MRIYRRWLPKPFLGLVQDTDMVVIPVLAPIALVWFGKYTEMLWQLISRDLHGNSKNSVIPSMHLLSLREI